jgi:TPR repeat protein
MTAIEWQARNDLARQAVAWYELAAGVSISGTPSQAAAGTSVDKEPHQDALYNLGMLLYEGFEEVVPQDRRRAAELFQRAGLTLNINCTPLTYV